MTPRFVFTDLRSSFEFELKGFDIAAFLLFYTTPTISVKQKDDRFFNVLFVSAFFVPQIIPIRQ